MVFIRIVTKRLVLGQNVLELYLYITLSIVSLDGKKLVIFYLINFNDLTRRVPWILFFSFKTWTYLRCACFGCCKSSVNITICIFVTFSIPFHFLAVFNPRGRQTVTCNFIYYCRLSGLCITYYNFFNIFCNSRLQILFKHSKLLCFE